jgi:hypothetical protein
LADWWTKETIHLRITELQLRIFMKSGKAVAQRIFGPFFPSKGLTIENKVFQKNFHMDQCYELFT